MCVCVCVCASVYLYMCHSLPFLCTALVYYTDIACRQLMAHCTGYNIYKYGPQWNLYSALCIVHWSS